jgi:hypothetical protein
MGRRNIIGSPKEDSMSSEPDEPEPSRAFNLILSFFTGAMEPPKDFSYPCLDGGSHG